MSLSRVATFAFTGQMVDASQRINSRLEQLQIEEASGNTSSDYGGLGSSAGEVLNFQSSIDQANAYASSSSLVNSRVNTMYSTLTDITSLLTNFKATLSSMQASLNPSTLIKAAANARDQLTSDLNTQFDGRYLFAGSRTDTAPVDLTNSTYDPATIDTPQTTYYQGDDHIASVKVSSSQTVSYGVTADQTGFETAMRIFASLAAGNTTTVTSSVVSDALGQLSSAMDDILVTQTGTSLASSALQAAEQQQKDVVSSASNVMSTYTSIDIGAITAETSTYSAQLQASYSALAKISSVNLVNYEK